MTFRCCSRRGFDASFVCSGTFSTVYSVVHRGTKQAYAMKEIYKEHVYHKQRLADEVVALMPTLFAFVASPTGVGWRMARCGL